MADPELSSTRSDRAATIALVIALTLAAAGCANWSPESHLHTGWALPAQPVLSAMPNIASYFRHEHELLIGWGNRNYYMARNPGVWLALRALLPSQSVILIQGIHRKRWRRALLPNIRLLPLRLDRQQF